MKRSNTFNALVDDLRQRATASEPGAPFPSVRTLMAELQASPVTLQRALRLLQAEGRVRSEPGRGTFSLGPPRALVEPDTRWQSSVLEPLPPSSGALDALLAPRPVDQLILDSGYVDSQLEPRAQLTAALSRAARRPGVWDRTPVEGLPELRQWFAHALGGGFGPQDVLVVPGGQAALSTAFRALARPGERVLVECPTYLGALAILEAAGMRPVPVPTDEHGIRPELLEAALRRTKARVVYLQPTFANPAGTSLATERRAAVLEAVRRADAFIVEDDWARRLDMDGPPPLPLVLDDTDGHVVHVTSLTKCVAPSFRIAALVARGPVAARLRSLRRVEELFQTGPLQHAAAELLHGSGWAPHLARLRDALRVRRDAVAGALTSLLPQLTFQLPRGGLHLWARLPEGGDDAALAERARASGLRLNPGRRWFPCEPTGPFVRISFGGSPPEELTRGIARLATLFDAPARGRGRGARKAS